jgi:predicted ATPase
VQWVLLARIDRLSDDLKQLLQVASVIGRVFSAPVLAEMAEHRPDLEDSWSSSRSWSLSIRLP